MYPQFDETLPDVTSENLAQVAVDVLNNQRALRDMILAGGLIGWAGTPAGGTAHKPATITYAKGIQRVRETITWGTTGGGLNNPVEIDYEASQDSGANWDPIGTLQISFSSLGEWTGSTWA